MADTSEQTLAAIQELTEAIGQLRNNLDNSSRRERRTGRDSSSNISDAGRYNEFDFDGLDNISRTMDKFKNSKMFENFKASNIQGLIDPFKKLNEGAGAFKTNMGNAIKDIKGANLAAALLEPLIAVGNILKNVILTNIDKFITKTLDLTESLYDVSVDLQKTLGVSRDASMVSIQAFKDTRYIGASVSDISNSYKDLFQNVSNFSMLTRSSQKALTEQGAILEKNGLSLGSYSAGLQIATKSMNMTVEEASKMNSRIVALGMDIGVSAEKMGSDFKGSSNIMAKLGSNGEQAFRRLAVAAKVTGMEMSRIVSITEKFDTFQGAAEQAGKLNAALGGNFVNAMDLMSATDPVERFEMIKDSILNAGLTFDTMSYYQKNYYKEALGLNDVGELAMMLSGNMKSLGGDVGKTSADFEKMADRSQKLQSLKDFFTNLFYNSIVPVLDKIIPMIQKFVDGLTGKDATQKFTGFIKTIAQVTSALAILVGVLTAALGIFLMFVPGTQPIAVALLGVAAASGATTAAVGGLGLSFSGLIGNSKGLGDLIPIFNKIKGVVIFVVDAFKRMSDGVGFSENGLTMLSETLEFTLMPILKALGSALVVVGAVSFFVVGVFSWLSDVAKEASESFGELSPIIETVWFFLKLIVGIAAMIYGGPIVAVIGVIMALSAAFDLVRQAITVWSNSPTLLESLMMLPGMFMDFFNPVKQLTNLFDSMSETFNTFRLLLSDIYVLIPKLIEKLTELGETIFGKVSDGVSNFITDTINGVTDAKVDAKSAIMQEIIQINKEASEATVKAITEAVANINITIDNKLIMDNRVLATSVNKITDETIRKTIRYGSGVA